MLVINNSFVWKVGKDQVSYIYFVSNETGYYSNVAL